LMEVGHRLSPLPTLSQAGMGTNDKIQLHYKIQVL
jgi:hypothetical protein